MVSPEYCFRQSGNSLLANKYLVNSALGTMRGYVSCRLDIFLFYKENDNSISIYSSILNNNIRFLSDNFVQKKTFS